MLNKAKKVIAIELDEKMCYILKDRFKDVQNLEIINKDVLKVDINTNNKDKIKPKIIANLPYYITTPIIIYLLKSNIDEIKVLIQKEVAERICATNLKKEVGAITYFVNYYADAEILQEVQKESFIPSPKVTSAIVKLKKLEKPRFKVKDEELLFEIIKTNFTKRRKTILNSLSNIIEKQKLEKILKELQINTNTRGETLSLEQYVSIVNLFKNT